MDISFEFSFASICDRTPVGNGSNLRNITLAEWQSGTALTAVVDALCGAIVIGYYWNRRLMRAIQSLNESLSGIT